MLEEILQELSANWPSLLVSGLIYLVLGALPQLSIGEYRSRSERTRPFAHPDLRLLSLTRDPDEHHQRIQKWIVTERVTMGMNALILLYVAVTCSYILFIRTPSIDAPMPLIGVLAFLAVVASLVFANAFFSERKLRSEEPSHVAKSAEMTVDGAFEYLMNRCLEAVLNMGAGLTDYDAHAGSAVAELPRGRLNVRVKPVGNKTRCTIHVESDSKLPTTWVAFGSNSANISRFVKEFFLTQ